MVPRRSGVHTPFHALTPSESLRTLFAGSPLPRRSILSISVNRQDNLPHPLTTLLFGVMVTVVGWASDYSPPYTKSSLPFCRGSLHPGPFLPLQPSKFPRNPLIGSPVSERNPSRKLDEQRAKGRCSPCSGVYAPVKCHHGRSQRSGRS